MKTTKKLALLLLFAAAGSVAEAQQLMYFTAGLSYTFTGTAATGTGISYQWYRDGQPIANATEQSYILPGSLANGALVEFKRGVKSSSCPDEVSYTNHFLVKFCTSGVGMGTNCWATANVDAPNTFATRADMYASFYQWNRTTAIAATGTLVTGWNSADNSETWTVNPCPVGWRLPTPDEFQAILDAGSVYESANSNRGNAVAGRFYGYSRTTCTLPNNMNNCIFLPAVGYRQSSGLAPNSQGTSGYYWTSTQGGSSANGSYYTFGSANNTSVVNNNFQKIYALSIRCVLQ